MLIHFWLITQSWFQGRISKKLNFLNFNNLKTNTSGYLGSLLCTLKQTTWFNLKWESLITTETFIRVFLFICANLCLIFFNLNLTSFAASGIYARELDNVFGMGGRCHSRQSCVPAKSACNQGRLRRNWTFYCSQEMLLRQYPSVVCVPPLPSLCRIVYFYGSWEHLPFRFFDEYLAFRF